MIVDLKPFLPAVIIEEVAAHFSSRTLIAQTTDAPTPPGSGTTLMFWLE